MIDPRKPAVPVAVEEDTEHLLVRSDGSFRRHSLLIYREEDADRIRQGYCCLNCGESQVDKADRWPFPEECWLCGFEMNRRQRERFANEFKGNIRVGPSTSIEEEMAIAEDLVARENREKVISAPTILVPRGI